MVTAADIEAMEAAEHHQEDVFFGDGDFMVRGARCPHLSAQHVPAHGTRVRRTPAAPGRAPHRTTAHVHHAQDGPEEDINFINDGSEQDAETNRFDQIVGALTGAGTAPCARRPAPALHLAVCPLLSGAACPNAGAPTLARRHPH